MNMKAEENIKVFALFLYELPTKSDTVGLS